MTTLIIGGGLIGSQIARLAVESGERPVLFDRAPQPEALGEIVALDRLDLVRGDVLNPFDLIAVIQQKRVSRIIHTAANPMLTTGAQREPFAAVQLNVMGTMHVLEAARHYRIERVVLCSSSVLYHYLMGGEDQGAPLKEEAYPRPATVYASTKQVAENLGLNYADAFGVDFVAVRFPGVFGPWRGRDGGGGPTHMMRTMLERSLNGESATLPARFLELIYSKDAALGAFKACHANGLKSRVFNIGMGEVWTPRQVAKMVEELLPSARVEVTSDAGQANAPLRAEFDQPLDLTRARTELRYEPQFPMQAALRDYRDFYLSRKSVHAG